MFYDIYLYTLCYYICCLLWRMYEMHPTLFFKTGCYSPIPPSWLHCFPGWSSNEYVLMEKYSRNNLSLL
jgi:hypothetical protein